MPPLKRADVPPGPLRTLIDALRELHVSAGCPSTRTLQHEIGRDVASHTAIHKVFTGSTLPTWGLVELLVEALSRRARRQDTAEVERVRHLWTRAANPDPVPTGVQSGRSSRASLSPRASVIPLVEHISEFLPEVLDEIEAVGTQQATGTFRIPTGFADLDGLLGGWSQGSLIVVGGRPSSGKTALLLSFCRAASIKYRLPSMFISKEMNAREIQTRILSAELRVSLHAIRTGQMNEDDWNRLARGLIAISHAPIMLGSSAKSLHIRQVQSEAIRLSEERGVKLVLIDGLHSIVGGKPSDYLSEIEYTLRELKDLAEAQRLAVIVSVQADRPTNGCPRWTRMKDLTASEAIERVADVVVVLDRPDLDDPDSPRLGEADLIVEKNRNGPLARVTVASQWHYSRFADLVAPEYPLFIAAKNETCSPARGHGARMEITD